MVQWSWFSSMLGIERSFRGSQNLGFSNFHFGPFLVKGEDPFHPCIRFCNSAFHFLRFGRVYLLQWSWFSSMFGFERSFRDPQNLKFSNAHFGLFLMQGESHFWLISPYNYIKYRLRAFVLEIRTLKTYSSLFHFDWVLRRAGVPPIGHGLALTSWDTRSTECCL